MKNILSILLVSVLLFGCSKDDPREELFGNWSAESGSTTSNTYCYDMTLSSNGQFVYQSERCSDGNYFSSYSGEWWIESNNLVLSGELALTSSYSITSSGLYFDGRDWNK
tara:strand:+ start:2318 stop:2647 length:330 start_codon:yes stop_codon:yes gene_type:complete